MLNNTILENVFFSRPCLSTFFIKRKAVTDTTSYSDTILEIVHNFCVIVPAGATKGGDEIVIPPSAANNLASQATCIDKEVGQTNSVPHANPVPGATDQSSNINPPSSENEQMQDLSLGTVVNLPSPSKDSSNNR